MPPLFTADDVLSAIEGLAHDDQLLVYQQLKRRLYPAHDELQRLVPEVRERRFREGVMCPHCQSRRTYRNGKALSRQRYVCRECQR